MIMQIPPVLLYHKIDYPTADVRIKGAFTSPRVFERQLAYLHRSGFEFLTASELLTRLLNQGLFPPKTVAITFDDGWKDNYVNAFPILRKYGVPATIFIVPSLVGETSDQVTADGEGPREHASADDIRDGIGRKLGAVSVKLRVFGLPECRILQ